MPIRRLCVIGNASAATDVRDEGTLEQGRSFQDGLPPAHPPQSVLCVLSYACIYTPVRKSRSVVLNRHRQLQRIAGISQPQSWAWATSLSTPYLLDEVTGHDGPHTLGTFTEMALHCFPGGVWMSHVRSDVMWPAHWSTSPDTDHYDHLLMWTPFWWHVIVRTFLSYS